MHRECSLLGCARLFYARNLCQFHYDRWRHGRSLDAPYKYIPTRGCGREAFFDWAACGTAKQYRKHHRHGIPVCDPCRQAEARRRADRRRKENHERVNARRRERWAANPELYRRRQREQRALKR